ncbi:Ff.00g009310.m01.CDS01 [Fusarium sp. VM40]|nr:Ff.00g009310.m01.CDS01 [Fusarium sp. VM40]
MNPPLSPQKSKRKRTISSGSYVVESRLVENLQSDFEEDNQEPGGTHTSKRSRPGKMRGNPKDQPCQRCFTKMIDNGPENLCLSQAKDSTTACYPCARDTKKKCQQLSDHLHHHGARLQAAALRIANDQPAESWYRLATAARSAMESGVEVKPKVAPRAQISQGPTLASAQTDAQVQLHPSGQSPPEVQDLPQPAAASQSPGDAMFQQMLAELRQINALSRETNQLLGEVVRQQREEREVSQRQADCLLRIILEMNAFNQGTEANLPPFE